VKRPRSYKSLAHSWNVYDPNPRGELGIAEGLGKEVRRCMVTVHVSIRFRGSMGVDMKDSIALKRDVGNDLKQAET